jgi:hypothetical protein
MRGAPAPFDDVRDGAEEHEPDQDERDDKPQIHPTPPGLFDCLRLQTLPGAKSRTMPLPPRPGTFHYPGSFDPSIPTTAISP